MGISKEDRLSYTRGAEIILEMMTLEDKVKLMSGNVRLQEMLNDMMSDPDKHYNYIPYPAGGYEKGNVSPMLFCDGPRGVVCGMNKATCFPVTMLRGATFDRELEEKIGNAIGKEIKAFGGNLFGGVCINLPYNPGWGRSQETYGEESYHLGEMGSALVKGVQDEGVIACIKHFAFNQMEISRFKVNVDCDKRTEREVFLPHFKKCIDHGAASVMSSYNLYKGRKCSHHNYLLNEVLKDEWGFDGFIISDFIWGVTDTVEAANGGQNIEMCCTQFFGDKLVDAVRKGLVPEEKINDAALRIIRTLIAFERENTAKYDDTVIGCKEHVALAKKAAEEGITLIKNDGMLPLSKDTERLVVLGKLGSLKNIGDHGSSEVHPPYIVTPIQGIASCSPKTEVIFYNGEDLNHAKDLAQDADAVIFVVGYDHNDEGEFVSSEQSKTYTSATGGDRIHSLGLHKNEIELIQAVSPENENSAVIMIGGNMIMTGEWEDSVRAVLMAYYPGMEGGNAIGEILFGDVNPSGKLPFVVPYKESDLPAVNWDSESQWYDYYHGYAKLEKEGVEPKYPYGFGLSYTTYETANASFEARNGVVAAECDLYNTGRMDGDEVMQLYIGFKNSAVDRPMKLLRGFKRLHINAGKKLRVRIECPVEELMWYNPDTSSMELEHMKYEVYIGTSSADKDLLSGEVEL